MSERVIDAIKGMAGQPDQEIFKVPPDIIQDFIGKVIVTMGGRPNDIQNVMVVEHKKKLRIIALIDKDSSVFACEEDDRRVHGGLTLLGASEKHDETELSEDAKEALQLIGYSYVNDDNRDVMLVTTTSYKKGIEIEFNAEVTMAIITDSDYSDKYFVVDASVEALKKKKHDSHKFKDKKKTIVFAKVYRSAMSNNQGFDPSQVRDWKIDSDDEDEDEDC